MDPSAVCACRETNWECSRNELTVEDGEKRRTELGHRTDERRRCEHRANSMPLRLCESQTTIDGVACFTGHDCRWRRANVDGTDDTRTGCTRRVSDHVERACIRAGKRIPPQQQQCNAYVCTPFGPSLSCVPPDVCPAYARHSYRVRTPSLLLDTDHRKPNTDTTPTFPPYHSV